MSKRTSFRNLAVGAVALLLLYGLMAPETFGAIQDPTLVPKYVSPLVKPPALVRETKIKNKGMKNAEYYEIAVRQFQQQILPAGFPLTTVWSYGPADATTYDLANRFFYPAFTIETKWKKPVVVKWVNGLVNPDGTFIPHLIPVDPSLHWANPIGQRDRRPNPTDDPAYWTHPWIDLMGNYVGPVPMITHVHGAHTTEDSDGYPEAWYLPAANNIGDATYTVGTFHDYFAGKYPGLDWGPGYVTFTYPNDQRATTLWYHDHTLGMTRVNVYAGPAGFYLLRGGPDDMVLDSRDLTPAILPSPAPGKQINPFGTFYEIPIAIQDRSFNADGSLYYPDNRAFFEGLDPAQLQIPFTYDQLGIHPDANGWGLGCDDEVSDVAPIWNPEFFGNMMVVNGQTWPFLDVEQRRYRFRLLNGCNSRFLILDFSAIPGVEVWQIGAEGGFLAAPVNHTATGGLLLMGPAERADVIVDFTNVPLGNYVLGNVGPDEPFGGGIPGVDFDPADPLTTGQVMQFNVLGPAVTPDTTTPAQFLQLPAITPLVPDAPARQLSLNEEESKNINVSDDGAGGLIYDCATGVPFGPTAALLGTYNPATGVSTPMLWMDPISENPSVGTTEVWEIYNFTMDAHPIHLHLVQFQVLDREPMPGMPGAGVPRPPEAWESGFKDTVIAYPDEITRVKARFDIAGLYVWHCHIVEHEDNEMMRPYHVGPIPMDLPGGMPMP